MRFDSFHLVRFGHFSERALEFAAPQPGMPDVHLIVGPNEAGKSTLRAAVVEFLFGMEPRSPFAFAHDSRDLALGASLGGVESIDLVRQKGRKDTLRRPDGTVVAEAELTRRFGGLDKPAFLRDFALGHESLVDGGRRLLANKSDLSALLFEAASGIAEFATLRRGLEERATELWARDGRKRPRFAERAKILAEAERAKRDAVTTGSSFDRLTRTHARAQQDLMDARRRWTALECEREHLQRLGKIARILVKFDELTRRLAECEARDSGAARLLDASERIDAFDADVARTANHESDIGKRRIEVQGALRAALLAAIAIGWVTADRAALAASLPPAIVRRDLAALADQRAALDAKRAERNEAVAQLESEAAAAAQDRAALVVAHVDDDLQEALALARKLGDVGARRSELGARLQAADAELSQRAAEIVPWEGNLEDLAAMPLVGESEIEAASDASTSIEAKIGAAAATVAKLRRDLAAKEARVAARRRHREIVEREQLEDARRERDALWIRLRRGEEPLTSGAEPFEERVRIADELADQRFAGAGAITEIENAEAEIAALRAELEIDSAQHEGLCGAKEQARAAWEGAMSAIGLAGLTPEGYRRWLAARRRVLEVAPNVAAAAAVLERFDAQVDVAERALRAALDQDGAAAMRHGIEELVAHAETCRQEAQRAAAAHEQHMQAEKALLGKLEAARRGRTEADRDYENWRTAFAKAGAACALPDGVGVEAVRDAVERMAVIDAALEKIREIEEERIARMEADLAAVAATAKDLARLLPDELRPVEPAAVVRALEDRLTVLRRTMDQTESLREQLTEVSRELADACDGDDLAGLRAELIERSVEARRIREDEVGAELERAKADLEANAVGERIARDELAAISGGDVEGSPAARAEEDRQAVIAELAAIAQEYCDVWLQERLLRWAIDRYRAENQSPLLVRASQFFRRITCDRFTALEVDIEEIPPVLRARRASGEPVGLDGLSDGTRDQLFLALRLAAVTLQLEQGEPLPFIADDLFVNFDDERAAAGFRALADLGMRTQVLYLSHHEHLVDVARAALGANINVVRL